MLIASHLSFHSDSGALCCQTSWTNLYFQKIIYIYQQAYGIGCYTIILTWRWNLFIILKKDFAILKFI
jgi:hypothetical protein